MRETKFDHFFLKGEKEETVLLLHGYGGNPFEMRSLGDALHQEGYSVYAPVYSGHGIHNLKTFIQYKPALWLQEALDAYDYLKKIGSKKIIVIGLSLGGVFTLKIGVEKDPFKIIPMSAPIHDYDYDKLLQHTKSQVDQSKHILDHEKDWYATMYYHQRKEAGMLYTSLHNREDLKKITCPVLIIQGLKDNERFVDSARYLDEHITSPHKLLLYENSGHVITMDQEKEKLHEDIIQFIQS